MADRPTLSDVTRRVEEGFARHLPSGEERAAAVDLLHRAADGSGA